MNYLLSICMLSIAALTIFLPLPYIFLRPYLLLLITLIVAVTIRPSVSRRQLGILIFATMVLFVGWIQSRQFVFEPIFGLLILWCFVVWALLFGTPATKLSRTYIVVFAGVLLAVTVACAPAAVAELYYVKGMSTKTIGNRITALTQAAAITPSTARYHKELSALHLQAALALAGAQNQATGGIDISNHIKAAINESQLVVKAEPKNADSWATLGITYLRVIGPVPDAQLWAQASFERAIKLDTTNPNYPLLLAQAYVQSNKPQQAEHLLDTLVTQFPHDARAPYLYASLLEGKNPSQARTLYQIALARADEQDAVLIQKRLDALSSQGK